ncbi:MAG: rod-binding protein [Zetaproteobacteria bacterium]|nr:rod-binding protein [Zetaproteobacteria bacterium]
MDMNIKGVALNHGVKPTPTQVEDAKLRKVTQDFEAIMYRQLLAEMRKSMPKSDLSPSNFATETHQSMMDGYMADVIAKHGNGSLAEVLYRQLSGHQAQESAVAVDKGKSILKKTVEK